MEPTPMEFPTPTSPLRRPDWLRESWIPRPVLAPRLDMEFESEFDSEEVLRAILEVPSSLDSVAEEDEDYGRADEHSRPRSFALSHSAPPTPLPDPPAHNRLGPSAAATSISSCPTRSHSPSHSPAIPNAPPATGHAPSGSHDHLSDPSPLHERRYTFGTAPTSGSAPSPGLVATTASRAGASAATGSDASHSAATTQLMGTRESKPAPPALVLSVDRERELAPPSRPFLIRPLPSPPVSATTASFPPLSVPVSASSPSLSASSSSSASPLPSTSGRAARIRPLPALPHASAHRVRRLPKLPTPPPTPAPTTSSASSISPSTIGSTSTSSVEFAPYGYAARGGVDVDVKMDMDADETGELGEVRAVTGHVVAVAATQHATRAAVQRHMPRESWTPPPQDEWSQAENGRWHLNFHDKRASLAPTLSMSPHNHPLLLQMRRPPSPAPKAAKGRPHIRVRVPHLGHFKKSSAA